MSGKRNAGLSNRRVVSYAMGDVANNLAFQMTSMFLMVYMTDIAGIPAALAGTIYAVTKVWAGVADLIAGNTVDKANTRWGRLRPWLLWGSGPLALTLVALFSGTALGIPRGSTEIFVYVLLVDCLFQLCYSFVNIPYGSLSAAMTQDSVDRSRLSGSRAIASAITGVALSAVISPQFQGIGQRMESDPVSVQVQFMVTCAVLGALAIAFYLVCFANTREVVPRSPGKVKLSNTLKMVGQNRPLLTLCAGAFFLLGAMFTMNAVAMYYTRSIVGGAQFFTFLMLAQTVGTI
ncbi:MAG: MFS transporter, partial [Actinomycetes bacterium]